MSVVPVPPTIERVIEGVDAGDELLAAPSIYDAMTEPDAVPAWAATARPGMTIEPRSRR
jgi:hypothetical protein